MGFTPDFSAIKASIKQKHKSEKVNKKANNLPKVAGDVKKQSNEIKDHKDKELLYDIVQEDFEYLVNELIDEENDVAFLEDNDNELLNQWKKERITRSLKENMKSFQNLDSLKNIEKDKNQLLEKETVNNEIYDSDGDIDLSSLNTKNQPPVEVEDNSSQQIIYRDEDGFRITRQKWLEIRSAAQGKYKVKKKTLKNPNDTQTVVPWSKGIVQQRNIDKLIEEEKEHIERPFKELEISSSYDKELKDKMHWEDPYYNTNTNQLTTILSDEKKHKITKPQCRFPAPPNRFNIKPGYRWDGVIRGTGYEQSLLKQRNSKLFEKKEHFVWSIEDI